MSSVLILSSPKDAHVPPVLQVLKERYHKDALWVDTQTLPLTSVFTARITPDSAAMTTTFRFDDHIVDLLDIDCIWYRRPKPFQATGIYTEGLAPYAESEAKLGIEGLLKTAPARWINAPEDNQRAIYKPLQLHIAREIGLATPPTIITNDHQDALAFFDQQHGNIIYKALSTGIPLRLETEPSEKRAVYTSRVQRTYFEQRRVACIPHLFQEYIAKKLELRITIVGKRIFATEIHSTEQEFPVDWRRDYSKHWYREHHLPEDIQHKLLNLVNHFHLHFAAIDMIVTPQDEYYFLEVNPNGQWFWLFERTGVPIPEALAHLLAGEP
jgi:glutathione synthase/RimK-type ligase-like ATP-grasp enzyme